MKTLIKIALIVMFFAISYELSATNCYADIPHLINYQGKLTDTAGKPVLDGAYSVTFRIYDVESGGSPLWEETQSVSVSKGIFSVMLGGVTNLNLAFDKPYWLEIKVKDEVMSPRQRMASAAYAITAENGVPRGVVTMWSGKIADIPTGWALCDGTNGTPDLRNRFVVAADADVDGVAKTTVTGTATVSGDGSIPAHAHTAGTLTGGAHTHKMWDNQSGAAGANHVNWGSSGNNDPPTLTGPGGAVPVTGSTGSTGTGSTNIAVYYALAFIMKL